VAHPPQQASPFTTQPGTFPQRRDVGQRRLTGKARPGSIEAVERVVIRRTRA
jgi:hypothetical protein